MKFKIGSFLSAILVVLSMLFFGVGTDKNITINQNLEVDQNQEIDQSQGVDQNQKTGQYRDTVQRQNSDLNDDKDQNQKIDPNGSYTSKEDVALYLYTYDELPSNFITKNEARQLGWNGGSLEPYAPGKCIGGDHFGNYERKLPEENGRQYFECDIDTLYAKSRGPKRIVYSDDGLIFYTADHYSHFEELYK